MSLKVAIQSLRPVIFQQVFVSDLTFEQRKCRLSWAEHVSVSFCSKRYKRQMGERKHRRWKYLLLQAVPLLIVPGITEKGQHRRTSLCLSHHSHWGHSRASICLRQPCYWGKKKKIIPFFFTMSICDWKYFQLFLTDGGGLTESLHPHVIRLKITQQPLVKYPRSLIVVPPLSKSHQQVAL